MSTTRPRLVVPPGARQAIADRLDDLTDVFEVIPVASMADAVALAHESAPTLVLFPVEKLVSSGEVQPAAGALSILEHAGEGVGVVDAAGELTWSNARLRAYSQEVRNCVVRTCRDAMAAFDRADQAALPADKRPGQKYVFAAGDRDFEAIVSVAAVDASGQVVAVVAILWDVTETRRLQSRIDAIDAAGTALLQVEAQDIGRLSMADRLRLLEDRIVTAVRDLLEFDNFEIRIIDRETKQLELVIAVGLRPLEIGEVIYASEKGNGISGWVAATGKSYICSEVAKDPIYREGLDAAVSSLTVPLVRQHEVVGVFNIESLMPNAFDETDRRLAEIFGRYIAMAMHILDLLVVERYTTNEQLASNVLGELTEPISEITGAAAALRAGITDPEVRKGLDHIIDAAGGIRRRLEACTQGPRSLIGAEQEIRRGSVDPRLKGKRIIVADNEPTIRTGIEELLTAKGCKVTVCQGGADTIVEIKKAHAAQREYDLVISDIRMPDRNGYEVYRAAKEVRPDLPVILMTGFGYDPHHSIVRASQEGLETFLFKPIKATQLLEAVVKALGV